MGRASHVHAVDLDDLIARLESAVRGNEAVGIHLLNHNAALKTKKKYD